MGADLVGVGDESGAVEEARERFLVGLFGVLHRGRDQRTNVFDSLAAQSGVKLLEVLHEVDRFNQVFE